MLVENWLTSSVKGRESALILRRYVVHGTFFMLLCWNEYSYRLDAGVSENLCSFLKEVKPLVLYSVEQGIAMESMQGKWASSRVDLVNTELFCIRDVHQCSSLFVTVFLGTLWCSIKKIEAPYMFDCEYDIALNAVKGNRATFPSKGMSQRISRVAARTWGISASYSGDGHSKLHFVQRSQDTCVFMRDTSGI